MIVVALRRSADRALLDEITAVATGALRNIRLDAELRALRDAMDAEIVEVAASRERLAAAAEAESVQLAAAIAVRIGPISPGFGSHCRRRVRNHRSGDGLPPARRPRHPGCGRGARAFPGVLPPVLTDHGLAAAGRALLRRVEARTALHVEPPVSDEPLPGGGRDRGVPGLPGAGRRRRPATGVTVSVRLWRDNGSLAFAVEHDAPSGIRASYDRVAALGCELRTEVLPKGTRATGAVPLTA